MTWPVFYEIKIMRKHVLRLIIDIPLMSNVLMMTIWFSHPLSKFKNLSSLLPKFILKSFSSLSLLDVEPHGFIWVLLYRITSFSKNLQLCTILLTFSANDYTFKINTFKASTETGYFFMFLIYLLQYIFGLIRKRLPF